MSTGGITTIDNEAVSGMVRRCVTHEIDGDATEIIRLAEAAHG